MSKIIGVKTTGYPELVAELREQAVIAEAKISSLQVKIKELEKKIEELNDCTS